MLSATITNEVITMIIDLTPSNRAVYARCEVDQISKKRFHLKTPLDSAVNIIAENLKAIFSAIPPSERDELVLTGVAPTEIYLTAQSIGKPFFHKVIKLNGKTREEIQIPQPNPDYDFSPVEAE